MYNIDETKVYTIEGNTNSNNGVIANGGAVKLKSYDLNSKKIAGYGRPNYKLIAIQNKTENEIKKTEEIKKALFSKSNSLFDTTSLFNFNYINS